MDQQIRVDHCAKEKDEEKSLLLEKIETDSEYPELK